MDDDNHEFFQLLNQTTQSFYKTLGNSIILEDQSNPNRTKMAEEIWKDYTNGEEMNESYLSAPITDIKRSISQIKHRPSMLNQPAFMYRPDINTVASDSK